MMADGTSVSLRMEGIRWARSYRSDTLQGPTPRKVTDVVQTGQQIWVRQVGDAWWLAQVPDVNSALVSINPQNGAVMALVGGFDFNQSKFNRANPGAASGRFEHQTVPVYRGDGQGANARQHSQRRANFPMGCRCGL